MLPYVVVLKMSNNNWSLTVARQLKMVKCLLSSIAYKELLGEGPMRKDKLRIEILKKYLAYCKVFRDNGYLLTIEGINVEDFKEWCDNFELPKCKRRKKGDHEPHEAVKYLLELWN